MTLRPPAHRHIEAFVLKRPQGTLPSVVPIIQSAKRLVPLRRA
jgi:hypothetical protein